MKNYIKPQLNVENTLIKENIASLSDWLTQYGLPDATSFEIVTYISAS